LTPNDILHIILYEVNNVNIHIVWIIDHIANTVASHTHDFYQMIFCTKKGGTISVDGKVYEAKQDYAYFVKPGTIHSITQNREMKTIDLKFYVHDADAQKFLSNVPHQFQLGDIPFMKMLFQTIAKEGIESKIYCNESTTSALKLLLIKMIHEFNPSSSPHAHDYRVFYELPEQIKNNTDIMILDLKNYIEENINKNITLEELSARVHINKTYFVKRFKILFGVTPIRFIMNMRIEKSKQLILDNSLSMQQIAEAVGFNSLHYFSAAFKQSEGVSPTEYYKCFDKQ